MPARRGDRQSAQIVLPTPVVNGALHRIRRTAMGHAQQSASVAVGQIDFHQARSGRHFVVSVPTETVGQAVHRTTSRNARAPR